MRGYGVSTVASVASVATVSGVSGVADKFALGWFEYHVGHSGQGHLTCFRLGVEVGVA
jgi:hypothetical protein